MDDKGQMMILEVIFFTATVVLSLVFICSFYCMAVADNWDIPDPVFHKIDFLIGKIIQS